MTEKKKIGLSDHFTYKKLLLFTFPSVIMMVFTSLYGVVDGIFVANFAGKTALAAINFVFPVLNILATFGYMFGSGGSALVSKTLGEGERKKANSLFSLFVYICFGLGVLFAIIGFFILKPLFISLGVEGKMLSDALIYGNILLSVLPFWNLQFLFQIFFITAERPKLGLYVTLMAGFTNMILDALFVGLFKWGIAGAAFATALSQAVGGALPLIYFFSKNKSLLRLGGTEFDRKAMLKGTSNGASEFISGVSGSLVGILYNTQLMKYAGEDGVAAYSIMMYVCFIFIGIFFGYANGVSPVIGFHYGAKNTDELKNLFKKSLVLLGSASLVMFGLSEALAKPLSLVFSGGDMVLFDMTHQGFKIYAFSFLMSGIAIFGSAFFTALNNGLISGTQSFLRTIFYQVATVLIFPVLWDIDGIWYSIVASEGLAMLTAIMFFITMRKKYNY